MPNVTITVPEDLKAEMDQLSEVSWSEICRNAISRYIQERKRPTPQIQIIGKDIKPYLYHDSGYPGLLIDLLIQNSMDFEIMVDRILCNVRFLDESGNYKRAGSDVDLHRRFIAANSMGGSQLFMKMLNDKTRSLNQSITKTFQCRIECIVFVEGFRNPFSQEIHDLKIPIDEWREFVKATIGKGEAER